MLFRSDAIRASQLMCHMISEAVEEGRHIHNSRSKKPEVPSLDTEEKAAEQAKARDEAVIAEAERDERISQENSDDSQNNDPVEPVPEEPQVEEPLVEEPVAEDEGSQNG